jgi:hypothetical protein
VGCGDGFCDSTENVFLCPFDCPGGLVDGGSGGRASSTARGGAGGSAAANGGSGGAQAAAACPTDEIAFTQATGCAADGWEFCLPSGDAAALAEVQRIDAAVTCQQGSKGRIGCDPETEQLCLREFPDGACESWQSPMSDQAWQTICDLAALGAVTNIGQLVYL